MQDEQPIIELPARLRLPQVSSGQIDEPRQRLLPVEIQQHVPWQQVQETPMPQRYPLIEGGQYPAWQWAPRTPRPQFFKVVDAPPRTPPLRLQQQMMRTTYHGSQAALRRPALHYIPGKAKRKEPGLVESLLGCGVLLVIGVLLLVLLYYLSS